MVSPGSKSGPKKVPALRSGRTETAIAVGTIAALVVHLAWRWLGATSVPSTIARPANWPLLVAICTGGAYLVFGLLTRVARGEFGSDLLAGISIVTSVVL